jgi:hypothetical protein
MPIETSQPRLSPRTALTTGGADGTNRRWQAAVRDLKRKLRHRFVLSPVAVAD